MTGDLLQYVIYDHPSDFPEYWVVRTWKIRPGAMEASGHAQLFRDVDRARGWIAQEYPGVVLVQGQGVDPDPVVFEVYM